MRLLSVRAHLAGPFKEGRVMFRSFNSLGVVAAALAVGCGLAIAPALPAGAATNAALGVTSQAALTGVPPYARPTGKQAPVLRNAAKTAAAASGSQTVINFANLANGTVVTNQYPGVTFSSTPGNVNYVSDQSGYDTPSFICTGPAGGGIDCTADTIVDFTSPVSGLTFDAAGVNDTGQVAEVKVYGASGLIATVPVIGDAGGFTAQLVDLSTYSDITSIDITDITDGAGIGWTNFSYTQNSCTASHKTVVTEHAGTPESLPELFTDTVTFSWCADASGHVQILTSGQAPAVETTGLSSDGVHIYIMNKVGLTFGVTPATAPVPAIHNEPDFASTTASGLSFYEKFDLGSDLADLITGFITDGLAARIVPLIRSGQLGRLSIQLLHDWGTIAAAFDSFAARNFGLPRWAANWVANLPIAKIKDAIAGLAGQFATTLTQSLAALGRNPTMTSVINALKSGIQQVSNALDFTAVDWVPQIITEVDSSLSPFVNNGNTQTAFGILVEDPSVTTTRTG